VSNPEIRAKSIHSLQSIIDEGGGRNNCHWQVGQPLIIIAKAHFELLLRIARAEYKYNAYLKVLSKARIVVPRGPNIA
jgi:hypothetical protein